MTVRTLHDIFWRFLVPVALAVLSFVIYACTVFALPQVRNARYCCEQSGIAAAVSNIRYGAPLGSLYSGVYDFFVAHLFEPLEQTLEPQTLTASLPATPSGELFETTRDGNGIGYPLVATAAFRLFGLHAWALTLTMLLLMALSAATFLLRFSGAAFASVVILYFSALTVMLFTTMEWDPTYTINVPVGGIRYFSLVSVLPLFHILFELLDSHAMQPGTGKWNRVLLGLQTTILVLAILVRASALSLIGAITLVWVALAWSHRRKPGELRALSGGVAVIGLVSVFVLAAIAVSVPRNYLTEERFGTAIWSRVTLGIGAANPAWPFPGVNDLFDCKTYLVEGFLRGGDDKNGICILLDYAAKHDVPMETIGEKTGGSLHETALREAFFKIAAQYPGEVLKTFLYYKPLLILMSIAQSLRFNFDGDQAQSLRFNFDGDQAKAMTNRASPLGPPPLEPFHKVIPYPPVALGLLVASLGIALAPFIVGPMTMQELRWVAGVTLLLALFTIPAYLAAWAMPHTSGDLLLYCLLAVGLALGAILVCVRSLLRSSQLVQAMAGFGGGSGAAESLNTAPLAAEASQQPLLTTPQHM